MSRLSELERAEAHLYADKALALVAIADLFTGRDDPGAPYMTMDLALECQIAPATAASRLRLARHLVDKLPGTLSALQNDALTIGQGIVLVKETQHLEPELCRAVELAVLPDAPGLTPGDTRREVARAIVRLDGLAGERRRKEQQKARRIWNSPRPDGRALIGGELSAEDAGSFFRNLSDLAAAAFSADDQRTADQQRADVFRHLPGFALAHADGQRPTWQDYLAEAGEPGLSSCPIAVRRRTRRLAVILVPVETALDLADDPCELVGYGPISGRHARELLADADLRKACTDRRTGRLVALDAAQRVGRERLPDPLVDIVLTPSSRNDAPEDHYRPSNALDELVRLRDLRCTGPGCATPAHLCDLDHTIPYPLGKTCADNLGPASRRCHNAKTHGGWQVRRDADGSVTWTSPLGRTWTQRPRQHLPNLDAVRRPRLVWPKQLIEIDTSDLHHVR